MNYSYDVIVIGAGHAGCEAAAAAARMGSCTLLITMDMNKIAQMSCNPAVGGIAKGQIVREIDALGGQMGIVTDRSSIQFRMLNRSKGPAMWSPRSQADRIRFIAEWRHILENTPNLFMWQDSAVSLCIEDGMVKGVNTAFGVHFSAKTVVLTAGTFLNGLMHVGPVQIEGGRVSEPASHGITEQLCDLGFTVQRMKTGTPVRLDERTIDFSKAIIQEGDTDFHHFSFLPEVRRTLKQRPCWIVYTNPEVHATLMAAIADSPLYNGQIQSTGPRYCPSIETKLTTFPDRQQHPLFLEPEGENTNEMYLNGFSSSMPMDVQLDALHKIPALRDAKIYRPGYAIEYDYFDPTQLKPSMESKLVGGLFFAGQVNGTTGYEEAGGQGTVAGINAALLCSGSDPLVMKRDESYIGVLIDDLTTKGVDEPYRMFTSRAEYRILLRQDDADARLTELSYNLGLATRERYDWWLQKKENISRLTTFCANTSVKPADVNAALEQIGTSPLNGSAKIADLIARPQVTLQLLADIVPSLKEQVMMSPNRIDEIVEATEIGIKYKGYIERERLIADKMHRLETIRIKDHFVYNDIKEISTEGRQKLTAINPETLAQASRIPGVSPSDINVLLVLMHR